VLLCNGACCDNVKWSVLCYCVMERGVLLCNGAGSVCYCVMESVVLRCNEACCVTV